MTEPEHQQESKSSVKIGSTAKGMAQPEVKVYEGTTEEEMQRVMDLAIRTFEVTARRLHVAPNPMA